MCFLSDSAADKVCIKFMNDVSNFHKCLEEKNNNDSKKLIFKKGKCC